MRADEGEYAIADELNHEFSGWEDRVEHPERYKMWPVQAAHLHLSYDLPKKRACVVALRQEGASNETIADILDRGKSTVSEHYSAFKESLATAEDLLDVMGPHPYEYEDAIDHDNWLPIARTAYEYREYTEGFTGRRTIKLFHERIGNAVENEYLIVSRKTEETETAGETRTTVTRNAVSGAETVISKLTRPFKYDIDRVGHLSLVYNGTFDPDGAIEHHATLRPTRVAELSRRLEESPPMFNDAVDAIIDDT